MIDSELARRYLGAFRDWAAACEDLASAVWTAGMLVSSVLRNEGRVLLCGNGGSAADAQHFAGEMVGRFAAERAPFDVTALTANGPVLTAVANDYGVDQIFARQVEAAAGPGDCLVVISTSGKSPNVLSALRAGRARGALNIALVGPAGLPDDYAAYADLVLATPVPVAERSAGEAGFVTPHIQEVHCAVLHCIAYLAETALSGRPRPGLRHRRPAVFLDRDGTLIEQHGYLTDPADVVLLPGAAEAVKLLNSSGVAAVVTTNQSAVARGLLDEEQLAAIHGRLAALLRRAGARLDGIYHCPHHPLFPRPGGICPCRKPLPGMVLTASADLGLDLRTSAAIGDSWDDVRAGIAAGCRGVLVQQCSGTGGSGAPGLARRDESAPLAPEARARCSSATDVLAAVRAHLQAVRVPATGDGPGGAMQ